MSAFEAAKRWWAEHGSGPIEELLGNYITQGGYVWISPTEFILAAEVRVRGREFWTPMNRRDANAWFIHLAVGAHAGDFIRLAPRPHPIVVYHRRGTLRIVPTRRFARTAASHART